MSNLFIIGNGFDKAHGLPTSYEDFHQFIRNNCKDMPYIGVVEQICKEPESIIDGMIVYEPIEYLDFFQMIIDQTEGPDWRNFEIALGQLDFSECLMDFGYSYETEVAKDMNSVSIDSIQQAILMVKDYFPLWISSILIDENVKKNDNIQKLLQEQHYIINFNYTETLEIVYGESNVFHVHGTQNSEIIFGHGNYINDYEEGFEIYPGADFQLNILKAELKKPVEKIIKENRTQFFLNSIRDVTKIYSYGFSYGSVDIPYIFEICKHIDSCKSTWYFNDFSSDEETEKYKKILQNCGFKGQYAKFHV